jgi:protein-glucosylgalactosylhydroxylysine glucosidase
LKKQKNKPMIRQLLVTGILTLNVLAVLAQKINRKALVQRHNVQVHSMDTLASLSVGNGSFAFTADATGLQSFPEYYANGVPLGTQSTWGWHSFPDTTGLQYSQVLRPYKQNGRQVNYAVDVPEPHNKKAYQWFRQNPHRLHLGQLGFDILLKNGSKAGPEHIQNIKQSLDMYTGQILSSFTVEGQAVQVITICHQQADLVSARVVSPLLASKRLRLRLRFPFPNYEFKDVGNNYQQPSKHHSSYRHSGKGVVFSHVLDSTRYQVALAASTALQLSTTQAHDYLIQPNTAGNSLDISIAYAPNISNTGTLATFAQSQANSQVYWQQYWQSGAAVDFSGSTHPQAHELERRVVLSQYLTKIQCAGSYPPQETGLTYNSWYGKPHLEMHWWHGAHFALWGRTQLLERSMAWYPTVAHKGRQLAARQGFEGIRWQKMTDNAGNETPSSIGAFLIWQQPHYIKLAEHIYRNKPSKTTLHKYKDLVFETANFMASFAYYDSSQHRYQLGPGIIPAQERFRPESTINPGYELAYWHWALGVAQNWRKRLGLQAEPKWAHVLQNLSPLAVQGGKYLFAENASDSYTNPVYKTDHPAIIGALGMLPQTKMVNPSTMQQTFDWIWANWAWDHTWGWDFPLAAMTATRLGQPERAVEALLMPIRTNTYLPNGHNYQDPRLTIYLPGNGGLLAAVALMCAGYDGCSTPNPGFPSNGQWKVRWEGLKAMP